MPFTEPDDIRKRREAAEALQYNESAEVAAARNRAQTLRNGIDSGAYTQRMDQLINEYRNRPAFQYDVNSDALYRQYASKYAAAGRQAMADTVGKAAAMTGGYGNSYGASAGAQAYNAYLAQASDIVPELANMAYQRYQDEGSRMQDLYNMYGSRQSLDYGMYRDALSDYLNERTWDRGVFDAERETALNRADLAYNRRIGEYQQGVSEDQFDRNLALQYEELNRNMNLQYSQLGEQARQFDKKIETGYGGNKEYLKGLKGQEDGNGDEENKGKTKDQSSVADRLWGGTGDKTADNKTTANDDPVKKFFSSVMSREEWGGHGSPGGSYQKYLSGVASAWFKEGRVPNEDDKKKIAEKIKTVK